jgi:hypothetical protein
VKKPITVKIFHNYLLAMSKTITIRLTGLAEKFIDKMKKQGLNEADGLPKALIYSKKVWRTNRVALIKEDFWKATRQNLDSNSTYEDDRIIEHYFHIQTPAAVTADEYKIPHHRQ